MPYEAIDEKTYNKIMKVVKPLRLAGLAGEEVDVEKYCENDNCII